MQTQGHHHSSRSTDLSLNFMSAPYLLNPLKNFLCTFVKFSSLHAEPCLSYPDSRSWSHIKVMVTLQGYGIYTLILCSLHISWVLWTIYPNIPLSETWLGCTDSTSSSHIKVEFAVRLHVHSISHEPFEWLNNSVFLSVRLGAEPLIHICRLQVKVTSRSWELPLIFRFAPFPE